MLSCVPARPWPRSMSSISRSAAPPPSSPLHSPPPLGRSAAIGPPVLPLWPAVSRKPLTTEP
jgi:hypothetical protein